MIHKFSDKDVITYCGHYMIMSVLVLPSPPPPVSSMQKLTQAPRSWEKGGWPHTGGGLLFYYTTARSLAFLDVISIQNDT